MLFYWLSRGILSTIIINGSGQYFHKIIECFWRKNCFDSHWTLICFPNQYCFFFFFFLTLLGNTRKYHANIRTFPYETKNPKLKFRINFFLISRTVWVNVKRAAVCTSIAPDHIAIFCGHSVRKWAKKRTCYIEM